MTFPGYKYAGANNPLEKQIQTDKLKFNETTGEVDKSSIIINPGNKPTNELDTIALFHDCEYDFAERQSDPLHFKHLADARMLSAMKSIEAKGIYHRILKILTQRIMGLKYKLGLGIRMSDILNEIRQIKDLKNIENILVAKGFLYQLNDKS